MENQPAVQSLERAFRLIVDKAVPLAKALKQGGLPCAEVTFRTAQGEEAIRRIAKEVKNFSTKMLAFFAFHV